MFNHLFRSLGVPVLENPSLVALWLILLNLAFNVVANVGFRMSAFSGSGRGFLAWQVVGNLAGLVTVLTLTALLRYLPLGVAFSLTTGLAILGVQLIAASWLFHETMVPHQWVGTLVIVAGIWLLRA